MACRRANWPTRRSPFSVNATTDGVVRAPSALGTTEASPPSQAAMTEFVVPRSIPTARAISDLRCDESGSLGGHLVVDDQFVAPRTHGGHRHEVPAAPLERVDDQPDDRSDQRPDEQSVEGEQQRADERIGPVEESEDPAEQRTRDGTAHRT